MSKKPAPALVLLGLCWLLAACGSSGDGGGETVTDPRLMARAIAEATAIAQQVQATSMAFEVRAMATALAGQPGTSAPPPSGLTSAPDVTPSPRPLPAAGVGGAKATAEPLATAPAGDRSRTEVLGVGLAAEGGLILVRFLAPPHEAEAWGPGNVSVADEGSGTVYDEVAILAEIGPLIGRPLTEGQMGYVLVVNPPPGLDPDGLVTVLLGTHEFKHVPVQ